MSVRVMTWVFESSRSKKNARLVLLAIADCANDEGRQAYPSMAKFRQKTGLGERAVTNLVADLEKLGELEVHRNGGPRGCNLYRVVMTPANDAPPQNMHPRTKRRSTPQITTVTPAESAPGTIREPSENHASSSALPPKPGKKSKAPPKKATRVDPNFTVTPEMVAWARANTPLVGAAETAKFIDYWAARPGKDGLKLDWVATWRNWMRNAQQRAEAQRTRASPYIKPASTAPDLIPADERCPDPDHRGQRASTCRMCASLRKAGTKT